MRIETEFPPTIISNESNIKVSIYMETSSTAPLDKNNRLRFKNLMIEAVKEIKDSLTSSIIRKKLETLYNDEGFWIHVKSGLVILTDETDMVVYLLDRKFANQISVGKYFYLNPLLRHFQSDDEYYILGLSKDTFSVYKGSRYRVEEIIFDDEIDITLQEVLGTQVEGRTLTVGNYGGLNSANYHGHNARSEEEKIDRQRYFQYIDRFVLNQFDDLDNHPVILLGLEQHLGEFRKLTNNPYILEEGVYISLDSIKNNEKNIHKEVWSVIEKQLLDRTDVLLKQFYRRKELEEGSSDLSEIYNALKQGRVDTLILEDEKLLPNTDLFLKEYDKNVDVLSVLLELGFETEARIVVLPKNKMPSTSGVFGLYRY